MATRTVAGRFSFEDTPDKAQDYIGKGGFSEVYRARDCTNGEVVVLKLVRDLYSPGPAYWQREVEVQIECCGPYTVELIAHNLGAADHFHHTLHAEPSYLALEYCSDGRAVDLFREQDTVAAALIQTATALTPLHALGGFHRDIVADNILVAAGVAKLSDFSLAHIPERHGPPTYSPSGTCKAPEIARCQGFSPAVDVYCLGMVAVHAMAQQEPVMGNRLALVDTLNADEAFKDLLRRMLAEQPGDRPTVEEVITEISSAS